MGHSNLTCYDQIHLNYFTLRGGVSGEGVWGRGGVKTPMLMLADTAYTCMLFAPKRATWWNFHHRKYFKHFLKFCRIHSMESMILFSDCHHLLVVFQCLPVWEITWIYLFLVHQMRFTPKISFHVDTFVILMCTIRLPKEINISIFLSINVSKIRNRLLGDLYLCQLFWTLRMS